MRRRFITSCFFVTSVMSASVAADYANTDWGSFQWSWTAFYYSAVAVLFALLALREFEEGESR